MAFLSPAAAAALAAALAGCGGSGGGSGSGQTSGAGSPGGGAVVVVKETEYKLTLSQTSVPAGRVVLQAENQGAITHALAAVGDGQAAKATPNFAPGGGAKLVLTLQPGTYTLWCPVDSHRGLGMVAKLRVT